jgi:riboflavin kinase/FMN adenylyltransferase
MPVQIVHLRAAPITDRPVVLTIGKFDGVHLGHQQLIHTAIARAQAVGAASAVMTFDPHPDSVIRPDTAPRLLTTLDERSAIIATLGPDYMVVAPFTRDTMTTPAADYMQQICHALPLRELWVGEGFALGRKREGDIPRLRQIGETLGYTVGALAPVEIGGEPVHSSRVRHLLAAGDVAAVTPLLGRPFALRARIIEGDRRGRTIGFPTANLDVDPQHVLPADGVYACTTKIGGTPMPAVTNIGMRPTFGGLRHTIETYVLDWSGDLYGQVLSVAFLYHLRSERKFNGIDDLKAQISHDIAQARVVLGADD